MHLLLNINVINSWMKVKVKVCAEVVNYPYLGRFSCCVQIATDYIIAVFVAVGTVPTASVNWDKKNKDQ